MNKKELTRISQFLKEAEELPDVLFTDGDALVYFSGPDGQDTINKKCHDLFQKVEALKIKLMGYFRALPGDHATYIEQLKELNLHTKGVTYNLIHIKNNEAWFEDKSIMVKMLEMAKVEFTEKVRIVKENPENSFWVLLKSKEAKIVYLTAFLGLLGFLTEELWYDPIFKKHTAIAATIKTPAIDSVSLDKTLVLDITRREVFENYYQMVKKNREQYTAISAWGYIDEFLQDEYKNIEMRIENRSYIHRFAKHENLWTAKDYDSFTILLTAHTITRMMEIAENVESRSKGAFTLTDDKLNALEQELKIELEELSY